LIAQFNICAMPTSWYILAWQAGIMACIIVPEVASKSHIRVARGELLVKADGSVHGDEDAANKGRSAVPALRSPALSRVVVPHDGIIARDPAVRPSNETNRTLGLDGWQPCLKAVYEILMRAKQLESENTNQTHHAEIVLKDMKAASKEGKNVWTVLQKDHRSVLESIERFASSTEEDDLAPSSVLTSDCLNKLNGRTDSPEFSNSSDALEGDMVVADAKHGVLIDHTVIQNSVAHGASIAINKWPILQESHTALVEPLPQVQRKLCRMQWHITKTLSLAFSLWRLLWKMRVKGFALKSQAFTCKAMTRAAMQLWVYNKTLIRTFAACKKMAVTQWGQLSTSLGTIWA